MTDTMKDLVEVTQADRDAAADYLIAAYPEAARDPRVRAVREGKMDGDPVVQAIARHRIASEARWKAVAEELAGSLGTIQGSGNAQGAWMDSVTPLIARFEIAAKFEADAVHNGKGADALAKLLKSMAERLDTACAAARQSLTRFHEMQEGEGG